MVTIKIDDRVLTVPAGISILEAAEGAGIPIPHLCYLKEINEIAACSAYPAIFYLIQIVFEILISGKEIKP